MPSNHLFKAFILTAVLVIASFASWEMYLRNKGHTPSYDDNESLWSYKRALVYEPKEKATVFVGSSRIKYDLDIPTWESITSTEAIQLAMVGSTPLPVLDNLADDNSFKGRLIIDVVEGLFFSSSPRSHLTPNKNLEYFKKITPAQRFSTRVNDVLESKLVFLDQDYFSLNALLKGLPVKQRPGVYGPPNFPIEFHFTSSDRQNIMSDKMISDTSLQNQVKNIWAGVRKLNKEAPPSGAKLDSLFATVKMDCDKIKARGGEVLFVRPPSSGTYLMGENKAFPREKYWDRLLTITNCQGIHFADYPAIAHFECPEFSHLSHPDAIVFTKNLIQILGEKGWQFSKTK